MNILVTGGAGFIGSHTVVALVEAGFEPIIVDDFSNSEKRALSGIERILGRPVKCYEADCNNLETIQNIFRQEQIQGAIHFAAFKAVGESVQNPLKYYENNLVSLITLLKAAHTEGVKNILFSSSATVYGLSEELPATEQTLIPKAMSPYGNTKQISEEILRDVVASGALLRGISLRYFNPIGAHPSAAIGELPLGVPNNLVPYITQTGAGIREKLTVFGGDYDTPDGTCLRDFIHVCDLAEAHVIAMKYLLSLEVDNYYDVFNVGTGVPNSVLEAITAFEEVSGKSLHYEIGARRDGDVPSLYADVSKIKSALGWTAKRSMKEGLADAWRWQQTL
ncbi:MAG: UDP-glucose 4-epimerase GalE [Saprospiraceae bacterium]|nr:UDP-glucose 4-epimerase GalE [Saprospiraceae bacterium]